MTLSGRVVPGPRVQPLDAVQLRSPIRDGRTVVLRPARAEDHGPWRTIRLRDEQRISPFWVSAEASWDERHSHTIWIRSLLDQRLAARSGTALSFVIEVDGHLGGELTITGIDSRRTSGELGIWVGSEWRGSGVARESLGLAAAYATEHLGLRCLTAPVAVDNDAAGRLFAACGFAREAVMAGYLDVGGRGRQDHALWVGLADEVGGSVEVSTVRWPRVVTHSPTTAYVAGRKALGVLVGRTREADPGGGLVCGAASIPEVDDYLRSAQLLIAAAGTTTDAGAGLADAREALRTAFEEMPVDRVWSVCVPSDRARAAVLSGAGLRREGTLSDCASLGSDGRSSGPCDLWAVTRSAGQFA